METLRVACGGFLEAVVAHSDVVKWGEEARLTQENELQVKPRSPEPSCGQRE